LQWRFRASHDYLPTTQDRASNWHEWSFDEPQVSGAQLRALDRALEHAELMM
jgi:hypothetical protein